MSTWFPAKDTEQSMLFVVCNVSDTKCSGRSLRTSLTFNITNWPKALLDAGGILALGSYYRWVKARHLSPPPLRKGYLVSYFRTFGLSRRLSGAARCGSILFAPTISVSSAANAEVGCRYLLITFLTFDLIRWAVTLLGAWEIPASLEKERQLLGLCRCPTRAERYELNIFSSGCMHRTQK